MLSNRNQAYDARIYLAVLDYNSHLVREKAVNKEGDIIYARKFRKQSRKWDATPTLVKKKYDYIPSMIKEIESQRSMGSFALKHPLLQPTQHPTRIQATIGNTEPLSTTDIIRNKKSRFSL